MLKDTARNLDDLLRRRLPIIIGRLAKDFFLNHFRISGFVSNGLHPWQPAKRQSSDSAAAQYGPLLSSRNHLYSSVSYTPSPYQVKIQNTLPYAAIHNQGGTIHPTVTPAMRAYAWRQHYLAGRKGPKADKWKALALTPKKHLDIHIPRRQFIGSSPELNQAVSQRIKQELRATLKK